VQTIRLQYPQLPAGVIAALFAVVLWAAAPLLIDLAAAIPPMQLTSISLLAGAVATVPLSMGKRTPLRSLTQGWAAIIYGLIPLLVLGAVGAYVFGLGMAPTAEAALITYTWPVLFIIISQWLIHKRVLGSVLGGATIAFAGAAVLLGPDAIHNGISGHFAGYALALLAGCCWALYSWLCQITPVTLAPLMPIVFLIASAAAAGAGLVSGATVEPPGAGPLAAGIALGVGPYGLAMVSWDSALRAGATGLVGSLAYAVPVLAALFLVVAGTATPDWRLPLACLLVVAGSVMASRNSPV
jgi:drug/metabolite transporter (DMT)-like permease